MLIKITNSALRRTKWHQYAVRFFFGGAITVVAGLIAKKFGPEIGGLFLAFPAIFPAAATLAQKHEIEKKKEQGLRGQQRGIQSAAAEAYGAVLGSVGLASFAVFFWLLLPTMKLKLLFPLAVVVWIAISAICWWIAKRVHWIRRRPAPHLAVPAHRASNTRVPRARS
jgi:succinate-acetate transporter protein